MLNCNELIQTEFERSCGSVSFRQKIEDVYEVDDRSGNPWAQFHQHSTYSFYARRSQKRKKTLMT